jgi:hypothetical protein
MTDRPEVPGDLPPIEVVDALPPERLPAFVLGLTALLARAAARITAATANGRGEEEQLLTLKQVPRLRGPSVRSP